MHGDLLSFYDKIPIARIINKFSNDIHGIEDEFLGSVSRLCLRVSMVAMNIYVCCANISFFIIIMFIIYFMIIFYYQDKYILICKDLFRLRNITKTPIINLATELIKGRHIYKVFGQ